MKLKQLICLLLAALLLGACGSPAAPTEATEETKPTDAWLDPVVPTDAAESLGKPEPVEDLTVPVSEELGVAARKQMAAGGITLAESR